MSSSNLSRRAILAGASSALPLIALAPAAHAFPGAANIAAASPPIDDPIFAAIEAHRAANAEYKNAENAAGDEADIRARKSNPLLRILLGEFDDVAVELDGDGHSLTWRPNGKKCPIYASTRGNIMSNVPRDLQGSARDTWIEERVAELEKEQKRFAKAHARTKLGKLEAIRDKFYDVERDRMWDLIWTVPTTLDGLSALLRYSRENETINELVHHDEWEDVIEWTIECAVCALAGLPEPPMSDVVASVWNENEADSLTA